MVIAMTEESVQQTPYCVVLTSIDSEARAETLAQQIVQAQLGACVQVQSIKSFYLWKGEARREPEFLLTIKTRSALYGQLEAFIRAYHSYETPEIVQLPITAGSSDYLAWIAASTLAHPPEHW
jgi:periplasmic divalent cation tolerance protein